MNLLESRQLRYFVAVAEELNFTRAAERLGIAPPALSRAIAQLEAQLATPLLTRTTRSVTLTRSGEVMLEQARLALEALAATARRTQRAGEKRQRLVLAVKADGDGGLLDSAMNAYARECPEVPLEVVLCALGEQPQMLRDGRADVALMHAGPDMTGVDSEVLMEEPCLLAIAAASPLASQATITLDQLASSMERSGSANIWQVRGPEGESLPAPHIVDIGQLLKLIEMGQLAVMLPQSLCESYPREKIAYRPVSDAPASVLTVSWPESSRSVPAATFVRIVGDIAAAADRRRDVRAA
jgi:DNA-binding transcriptional LysR family regulator